MGGSAERDGRAGQGQGGRRRRRGGAAQAAAAAACVLLLPWILPLTCGSGPGVRGGGMGEAFDMYRRSEIGMALTETLDEMVGSGALSPKQAIGIFLQFDKELDDYLKGCRFLPNLNNEILGERNAPYKERLSSLENLVLIMG